MEHRSELPIGAKVELLDGCDEVYSRAVAGSRGYVRRHKVDDYGFALVYVEWDREHWRDNDEPDGWTFPGHFKILETPDLVSEIIAEANARRDAERCAHCGQEHEEVDESQQYLDVLHAAVEDALESEAFFIITLKEDRDAIPGYLSVVPRWYSGSLTDDAQKVLATKLAFLVELAERRMRES